MASVTDSFDRANAADLGANWTKVSTQLAKITSNQAEYNGNGSDVGYGYNAATFLSNAYCQLTIVRLPNANWCAGPVVRATSAVNAASGNGYGLSIRSDGLLRISRNASFAADSATGVITAGDIVRIEDRGGGLIYGMRYRGGTWTDIVSYTDGSPLSGQYTGMFCYFGGTQSTTFLVDNWEAGDLSGGASTTRGMPFGNRSTAFNGGRVLHGPIN